MLYYENPYLKELNTEIVERKGDEYLLKHTILYPGGGGQPPDRGFVLCGEKKYEIVHLGDKWHRINGDCEGEVKIILDWNYRYYVMKSHTAEHAFFRFLQEKGAELVKINLGLESTIFFRGEISIDDVLLAEMKTRELIKKGANVRSFWIRSNDIERYPELRIKRERIKGEKIRIVEIESHDLSACTGIHVKNLSEIGDFAITRYRRGKIKEVKFVVDEKAKEMHYMNSTIVRRLSWKNNVDSGELEKYVENLKDENHRIYEILRNESMHFEFRAKECNGVKIFWQIFYDDRIGVRKMMEKVNREGGIVMIGNPLKKSVSCAFEPRYGWIRERFLNFLQAQGGKGGGKGNFVSGSVKNPREFIEEFIAKICESSPKYL